MTESRELQREIARLQKRYGARAASIGSERIPLDVVPTGSLALDYALGTGGWPRGHPVEVYGPDDIGKSSVIGFSAMKNAIAQGMNCGLILLEPGFDADWAERNGVDTERVAITRPDSSEAAFSILAEWVMGDTIDFILFDSIGALLRDSENIVAEEKKDGNKTPTPNAGGASLLMTWGIKNCLMPAFKNNKCVIFLNQIRDVFGSRRPGQTKPYGAKAMRHLCAIRVSLSLASGGLYTEKEEGDSILIGRKIVAQIRRNKLSEGSDKRAEFSYYLKQTPEHDLGIDVAEDVVATAIRTQVIEGRGYYRHPTFPGKKHQLQGKETVGNFLLSEPKAFEQVREEVLGVMLTRQGAVSDVAPGEEEEPEGDD